MVLVVGWWGGPSGPSLVVSKCAVWACTAVTAGFSIARSCEKVDINCSISVRHCSSQRLAPFHVCVFSGLSKEMNLEAPEAKFGSNPVKSTTPGTHPGIPR